MTHIFTVLFTVQGKDPAANKYVDMAHMMLHSLWRTGHTGPVSMLADELTWVAFESHDRLAADRVQHIPIPRPATLLEGIARRYEFFNRVPEFSAGTTYLYIDCDMINIRPFTFQIPADTIVVYPEGGALDPNYCGEGNWAQLEHPGLSAGFWGIRPGPDMLALMDEISASVRRGPHNFYTVEQVHMNACITKKTRAVYFKPSFISFNGHGMTPETAFINCAGCPGVEDFHYDKMAQFSAILGGPKGPCLGVPPA